MRGLAGGVNVLCWHVHITNLVVGAHTLFLMGIGMLTIVVRMATIILEILSPCARPAIRIRALMGDSVVKPVK